MDPDMTSSGNTDHEIQQDLDSSKSCTWSWVASQPMYINMASVAAQTTDNHMSFIGDTDRPQI